MGGKDWAMVLIPIFGNGVLIYLFQLYVTKKIEKRKFKDAIELKLYDKLAELNQVMIQSNANIQSNASNQDIGEIVRNIYNCVVEVIKYYDTNKSILQRYQEKYESWNNKWNIFADSYHKYQISNYIFK